MPITLFGQGHERLRKDSTAIGATLQRTDMPWFLRLMSLLLLESLEADPEALRN